MSFKKEINQVIDWLRGKVTLAHSQGLVVGLSGGIDSSVCAALIKLAYPNNSLGIILPIDSQSQDAEDAEKVANTIGINYYKLDLTAEHKSILDSSLKQLECISTIPAKSKQLTDANLKARLRMTAIYTASNALNYLVIGTDNAAEFYTGYFTKFGDGACDLLPLAEFSKGEVRTLAEELDIPKNIINKPPSAGLWEGQTDEEEMGISYDRIDNFLKGYQIPTQDKELIERLHSRSEHKRQTPPVFHRS